MRFLRIYRQPQTTDDQFAAIKHAESLALNGFTASDMKQVNKLGKSAWQEIELLRKCLQEIGEQRGIKNGFFEEEHMCGDLFRTDFYIESAQLAIDVNGMQHFYPYTTRPHQFTSFKTKLLRGNQRNSGQNVLYLHSHHLEKLAKTPGSLVEFIKS